MSKRINIIVAVYDTGSGSDSERYKIGFHVSQQSGSTLPIALPWISRSELALFKKQTMGSTLIVGRKTYENLPPLPGREVFEISRSESQSNRRFSDIETAIEAASNPTIYIAGGGEIYREGFGSLRNRIDKLYISFMREHTLIDRNFTTSFPFTPSDWILNGDTVVDPDFIRYELVPGLSFYSTEMPVTVRGPIVPDTIVGGPIVGGPTVPDSHGEVQYLKLLKTCLAEGSERKTRNGITKSVFGKNLTFDLRKGFPLLTTKKMFWKGIVEELLMFIRGETDTTVLEKKGVNIWSGNTNSDFLVSHGFPDRKIGEMGPMYGYQWRRFGKPFVESSIDTDPTDISRHDPVDIGNEGVDQLSNAIYLLLNDPTSRRILMTTYNPAQADEGVLYPCHSLITQFYTETTIDGITYLDMTCYNRSSDLFHGLPFNIASSALFQFIIGKVTGYTPRFFYLSLGDCHIYESHFGTVSEQLNRVPYASPTLTSNIERCGDVESCISKLESLKCSDFKFERYDSHPVIKAGMIP